MHDKIKALIAQALGIEIEDVDETSLLREDLGLEAPDLAEILLAIKQEYKTLLGPEDIEDTRTVADLIESVENSLEQ